MGKRKHKSKQWENGRRKAGQPRTLAARVAARVPETSTVPTVEGAHPELSIEEASSVPDYALDLATPDADGTATRPLTLTEMLAQQPEHTALFHPCEGCGKVVRGDAPRCEECSAVLEEEEALSREEKARHEQRMRRVRTGVVVTVLVTIFGTYFWFNDPRKLLDGLLPGLSGTSQAASVGEVAYAGVFATPSLTVARAGVGATPTLVNQDSQDGGLLKIPGMATPTLAVAQDATVLPTLTFGDATAISLTSREATAIATDTPRGEAITPVRSATPTSTATRPRLTPTRDRPAASTPTTPRLSPTSVRATIITPTRTHTPFPVPTSTPTPLPATASPTREPVITPTATHTALPVLPTATPVLPAVTVALPTATLPLPLPTVSVVPTEVRLPEPTVPSIPTADLPSVLTVPLPTVVPPTVVIPTAPAPPTVAPTVVLPTVPAPTAEVPTVQVSVVPTDLPAVATPTVLGGQHVVPTATLPVVLP